MFISCWNVTFGILEQRFKSISKSISIINIDFEEDKKFGQG